MTARELFGRIQFLSCKHFEEWTTYFGWGRDACRVFVGRDS